MTLSQSEIRSLAMKAGLSASSATIAAAIAMAESGGNPNAHNANASTGDDSYGLWQINMLGALGPSRRATYGLKSNSELYNVETNARIMSALSHQGQNFSPWSTYTNGAYRKFLSNSTSVNTIPVNTKPDAFPGGGFDPLNWFGDIASTITATDAAASAFVHTVEKTVAWWSEPLNWVRVAYVALGGAAVVVGVVMVLKSTEAGETVYNSGKKLAVKAAGAAVLV